MRLRTTKAAKRLDLHPCELVLRLAPLVASFDDVYPELDEGFLDTLSQMAAGQGPLPADSARVASRVHKARPQSLTLSTGAGRIAQVMANKGWVGRNKVSIKTLRNHHCRAVTDFDAGLTELRNLGMVQDHKGASVSLSPKAKRVIQDLPQP